MGGFSVTRRDWLRLLGAGAATLAVGCEGDPAGNEIAAAILEPTTTGFLVSVWARSVREVSVAIVAGPMMRTSTIVLGDTGTGVLVVDDLEPDRDHEVLVATGTAQLGPHRVRTAPADATTRAVRIAVAADVDPNPEFASDLVDHVLAAKPELLVTLGDFPYTDNGPPAQTLDEYRERHIETRVTPRFRALLEGMPVRAIYDDHEFRNNWDRSRATNEPDRYAAAMRMWDEFFPLRDPAGEVRYRSWRWGANLECFLLDCRRFRHANTDPDVAAKSMLGLTQRQWLLDSLAASTATFKLVFTSVPLDFADDDSWFGFQSERNMLFDAIVGIPGILFVSADQHYFAAYRHAHGIREFQVGPLARGLGMFGAQGAGVLFRAQRYNVGVIDVESDRLVFAGLGAGGDRFYEETFSVDDLTPRRTEPR